MSDKMRVQRVPASSLKPGDIFFDSLGKMVKMIFRSGYPHAREVNFSCVDGDGLPCLLSMEREETVTKVTDRRVTRSREA